MTKFWKIVPLTILSFIFSMMTLSHLTFAADSTSITIHFKDINSTKETTIGIWKIPDTEEISNSTVFISSLENLSNEEIEQKFGRSVYEEKVTTSQLLLSAVPYGKYYVRELNRDKTNYLASLIFEVYAESPRHIYAKQFFEVKTGKYHFKKIEKNTEKVLAGAVFGVYTFKNDQYEPVYKNSKPYQVVSDAVGHVEIEDLPYGVYYLKEEKAPAGYQRLKNYISFTIDAHSVMLPYEPIENEKVPPIEVPYTGSALFVILMGIGLGMFVVGYVLNRKVENE